MYTVDEKNTNDYDDVYVTNSFWDNNKGLIIKIIIIILCIIVLIWLFKALKTKKNNVVDESVYVANVEKVRLAAEDYFFINGHKSDNTNVINLSTLRNNGLVSEVVDANNKVCSENTSKISLSKEDNSYKMAINLVCSTDDKEEVFYYRDKTLACLNCNGKTHMTGDANKADEVKEEKEVVVVNNEGDKNDDNVVPISNEQSYEYSCVNWSDWSKNRVNEPYLEERSKTLVRGVKYGGTKETIVYGEWSEYTTTPQIASDVLEVETIVVTEDTWSEVKKAKNINSSAANIKVLSTERVEESSPSCSSGYMENNICYSNVTKVGNLTLKEYNSGKYRVQNNYCERVETLKNSEGKYVLTYVGCKYNEMLNYASSQSKSYTLYTYQELIPQETTYYRSRSIETIVEPTETVYTENLYDEEHLPDGYVKLPSSEVIYYSYKIATCEK